MIRVCIDTSAYSNLLRGHPAAIESLRRAPWLGVPAVVLGELRAGFASGRRRKENEATLREFLARPVVQVLDVDDRASAIYGDIWAALRAVGTPLPTNDVWIAAVAAREGATVVTYDAHFAGIERVATMILES